MKKTLLTAILLMVLTGCNNDDNNTTPVVEDTFPQQLEFTTILNDLNGWVFESFSNQKFIIQNENDWNDFKNSLDEYYGLYEPFTEDFFSETEIDFNTFQVIAVFDVVWSYMPSGFVGEEGVFITGIIENEDFITVNYFTAYTPSPLPAGWQSAHIIKMPKSDKEIIFIEQDTP